MVYKILIINRLKATFCGITVKFKIIIHNFTYIFSAALL